MPDTWLREHPDPTPGDLAAEVSRLHFEARRAHRTTKIAIGAFVFAAISSGMVWGYADRVADQARTDAVQQAEQSRAEIDRANCRLYGLFLDVEAATTEQGGPPQTAYRVELRKALADAYTAPRCVPPLSERVPFPLDGSPSPAPTSAPPTTGTPDPPAGP